MIEYIYLLSSTVIFAESLMHWTTWPLAGIKNAITCKSPLRAALSLDPARRSWAASWPDELAACLRQFRRFDIWTANGLVLSTFHLPLMANIFEYFRATFDALKAVFATWAIYLLQAASLPAHKTNSKVNSKKYTDTYTHKHAHILYMYIIKKNPSRTRKKSFLIYLSAECEMKNCASNEITFFSCGHH